MKDLVKQTEFRNDPRKVSVIAPIYDYFPTLAPAMMAQTHQNWELVCIHDGPNEKVKSWIEKLDDERIIYMETERRYNDYGHTLRAIGLNYITDPSFILHTNMDNYYVPIFLEEMVAQFKEDAVALFCDMVHSHKGYKLFSTWLERAAIDCGAVLWEAKAALQLGWKSREFHADWLHIDEGLQKFGKERFYKHAMPFFIHN